MLVLVVVFAVNAVRRVPSQPVTWGQGPSQPAAQDPRAILAERLAKGEISQDEFDTAMRALGYGGPPPPA